MTQINLTISSLKREHFSATNSHKKAIYGFLVYGLLTIAAAVSFIGPANAKMQLPDYAELVERNGPAVVKITSVHNANKPTGDGLSPQDPSLEGLPEYFKRFFEQMPRQRPSPREGAGFGSGFIISKDGYVLTNHHVIDNASKITVSLQDRSEYTAKLIGSDSRTDIALLKIEAKDLPIVTLGNSDDLKVGQWVLAIGSPFGFEYTATQGIVSALSRSLPDGTYVPFIQTDVAVNPGNSGGPLFSTDGKVIGINSQIYTRSGGYMGLSFAIPINVVKDITQQLKENGRVSRGWLGVAIQDVDQSLAESFGLNKPKGALISDVTPDSPAGRAKLKAGDVILSYNSHQITRSSDLPPFVGTTPVGDDAKLTVLRNRQEITINVTIGELPGDGNQTSATNETEKKTRLGISIADLNAQQKQDLNLEGGALVQSVEPSSPAAKAGIRPNDVITQFDQKEISSAKSLSEAIQASEAGSAVSVLISRGGNALFLAVVPR